MRQRIREEWRKFSKAVMPKKAPPAQQTSMRASFFAGASIAFAILVPELPESAEEADKVLDEFASEIQSYFDRCAKGII